MTEDGDLVHDMARMMLKLISVIAEHVDPEGIEAIVEAKAVIAQAAGRFTSVEAPGIAPERRRKVPTYCVMPATNEGDVADLPKVIAFVNGVENGLYYGVMLDAATGEFIEGYAGADLDQLLVAFGLIDPPESDGNALRHALTLRFPAGYRIEFVDYDDVRDHAELQAAMSKSMVAEARTGLGLPTDPIGASA